MYYLRAASGGGTEMAELPLVKAYVRGLPDGLSGLVVTSDLQGIAPMASYGGATRLLGEALVEHLEQLADTGEIPPLATMGALLAGDLFSGPHAKKRGATGDVTGVWLEFARTFAWVAGVAGNHDLFPEGGASRQLERCASVAILDGEIFDDSGLVIGGVSGIIGTKRKVGRKPERLFLELLTRVLKHNPAIVVLHQGPPGRTPGQVGEASIREHLNRHLKRSQQVLVICGHAHWNEPLSTESKAGWTVVNVDSRVLVLLPEPTDETAGC